MQAKIKPYLPQLAFAAYLIALLLSARAHEVLFLRPQSVHQWRQADCASHALNYHQNDISFWTPQLHNVAGEHGFAASEFPLLYYTVGKLYSTFGFNEAFHRGLSLSLALISWWLLFVFSSRLIGNAWLGMVPAVLLSSSPFYFYYANNFLPNVPAIAFALMGWWAFFAYVRSPRKPLGWLYLMGAFMLLSALTKVSEGISFVAILGLAVLSLFPGRAFPEAWMPRRHWPHLGLIALSVVGLTAAWYRYARLFNQTYGNKQSLLGIFPVWEMGPGDWELADYMIWRVWWPHFHHPAWLWALGLLTIAYFVFWLRVAPLLRWTVLLLLLGVLAYSLLWFKAFPMHDYYMLTLVIYPVFLLLAMLELLARGLKGKKPVYQWVAALVLISLSYLGLTRNDRVQWRRYHTQQFQSGLPEGSYTLTPYLRSLGIERQDKVVSVPDQSPNITLYLMNQPGYSEAFGALEAYMEDLPSLGAKYLIVHDSSYLSKPAFQPYLHTPMGSHQGVWVYDIRKGKGGGGGARCWRRVACGLDGKQNRG